MSRAVLIPSPPRNRVPNTCARPHERLRVDHVERTPARVEAADIELLEQMLGEPADALVHPKVELAAQPLQWRFTRRDLRRLMLKLNTARSALAQAA